MALSSGTRLGPYEVLGLLGAGGMGEVYRARDIKLHREVALKILPDAFANDPERLARFTREAHTLAALNHPHIAAIYGLEDTGPGHALVMELVEGPTLQERIGANDASGATSGIDITDALAIARQIADALDAAHERGIVHRDLKPANVKVRDDGTVKVLDFGLAKALGADGAAPADAMDSPTITTPAMTRAGVILGTAAYMSPEQARGQTVDARTDLWAFGCVLYEMLTGTRAFPGESVTDTLAAVVKDEPKWDALPQATPAAIHKLLRRCLAKDRKRRLASASDARLEIEDSLVPGATTPSSSTHTFVARSRNGLWVAATAVTLAAIGLAAWRLGSPPTPALTHAVHRSTERLPAGTSIPGAHGVPALSPDGKRLAFVATNATAERLYVRAFDQVEAVALDGTEGAADPFFSPDGEWVAFAHHASGQLKKVNLQGGGVVTLTQAPHVHGGYWSTDGFIYYTPSNAGREGTGVWRISANGGTPEPVTTLDADGGEVAHEYPFVIDRRQVLLYAATASGSQNSGATIVAQSLATGERKTLVRGGYAPRYLESGHVVFMRNGSIWAAPFDIESLQLKGDPAPVLNGIASQGSEGVAQFGVAPSGDLTYVSGVDRSLATHLVVTDRSGKEQWSSINVRGFSNPRVAPDGLRYAVGVDGRIEIGSLNTTAQTRLTEENTHALVWTMDGRSILFTVREPRERRTSLVTAPLSGLKPRPLLTRAARLVANDVTADGSAVVFSVEDRTGTRLWRMNLSGEAKPERLFDTVSENYGARFSPGEQWLAYFSNDSGRQEVYVRSYPGLGPPIQISSDGGVDPRWARDGKELLYRSRGRVMVANVTLSPAFKVQPPRVLFEGNYLTGSAGWDVTPDGERFLLIKPSAQAPSSLIVVKNWAEEVKRLVPYEILAPP